MPQDWFDQNQPGEDWFDKNKPQPKPKEPVHSTATISSSSKVGSFLKRANYESQQADNPLAIILRKIGGDVSEALAPRNLSGPQPESKVSPGYLRSFLAGSAEAAGELGANLTSPQNIALNLSGYGAIKKGSEGAKAVSRVLSTPILAEGAANALGPDRTPTERGMGIAQAAGGLAGMYFPHAAAPVRIEPQIKPRLLPSGAYHVSPEGVAGVPIDQVTRTSMRERLGGTNPESPIQAAAPDVINVKPTKVEETVKPVEAPIKPNFELPRFSQEFKPDDLFKGSEGKGLGKESFESQWQTAIEEAKAVGLDYTKYDNLDQLQWDITRKAAIETVRTGKNPIAKPNVTFEFAREGTKTKLGANPEILGKILASGYKGNMPQVVTKELLQNAIDAVRHKGPLADVKVTFNEGSNYTRYQNLQEQAKKGELRDWQKETLAQFKKNPPKRVEPYIEVADNGNGLTREQIDTVYTDLGESGKRDDTTAVGGFGIAKASYLIGSERVEVSSVARDADGKLYEHSFSATPDEILHGFEVKTKPVPEGTPTGTKTRVFFKDTDDFYSARKFAGSVGRYSTGRPGVLTIDRLDEGSRPFGEAVKHEKATIPGEPINLSDENADVELLVPEGTSYGDRSGVDIKLLNNGMYQGEMHFGGWNTMPNVPEEVILNVKAKVPEGHANYPFTMTREDIKGPVQEAVAKYVDENIIKPGVAAKTRYVKELYDNIENRLGVHYYDAGKKFTPEEFDYIVTRPQMLTLGKAIDKITREVVEIASPEMANRLDKVGIFFDQGENSLTHGIWIPDPGTEKASILINPLGTITGLDFKVRTPFEAATAIHHTIMHEVNHFRTGPHNEEFTSNLSKLYEAYGKQGFFTELNAKQQIYRQLTGGGEGYLPEVQDILRVYQESRRRPGAADDPLYRTGIKSADNQRTGEKKVRGNIKRDPEAATPAVGKLIEALRVAIPLRQEQNAIYAATRGERFREFLKVNKSGRAGAEESLSKLSGEMEKVVQSPIQLDENDTTLLFDSIKYSPLITPGEKARGYVALMKLIDGGPVVQPNEIAILDRVYGNQLGSQIQEMYGGIGGVGIKLGKTANTMKTLMSSLDVSAPFRQGAGKITRKEFWNAYASMFKFFGSEQAFRASEDAIIAHPNYILSREHGLYMASEDLAGREEQFLESYISDAAKLLAKKWPNASLGEKIIASPLKGVVEGVRASERAYTGFLNKLRFDTFNSMIDNLTKAGYTPDQVASAVAREINISTGRGNLPVGVFKLGKRGPDSGRNSNLLNVALFSPRLIASRLTVLNPKYYIDTPSYMRMEALRTLFGIAGTVVIANGIGSLLGGDPTLDPRSSDFGKIRFGKTRLDPGAGFLQYIILAARLLSNETKTSANRTYDMSKGAWNSPNRYSLILGSSQQPGFIESKGSPAATLVTSWLRGKNFAGQPLDLPAEVKNRFVPIILQDLSDLYKDDPTWIPELSTLALGGLAASGMGVQTYEDRKKKMQLKPPSMGGFNLQP